MSPPPKETPQVASLRRKTYKRFIRRRNYRITAYPARVRYLALVAGRYTRRLLEPFVCYACGVNSLDPIGRNAKHEFLCDRCSEGSAV